MSDEGRSTALKQYLQPRSELLAAGRLRSVSELTGASGRMLRAVRRYLAELSPSLATSLSEHVELRLKRWGSLAQVRPWLRAHAGASFLDIRLRLFCEPARLFVPVEVVHELAASLLERDRGAALRDPSEEELTAFSYVIAKLIAEEPLFADQRAYLCGLNVLRTSASAQQQESSRDSSAHAGCLLELGLRALPQGDGTQPGDDAADCSLPGEYPLYVCLSEGIVKRIQAYAVLHMPDKPSQRRLLSAKTRWNVRARLPEQSLFSVLSAKPGTRISLGTLATGLPGEICSVQRETSKAAIRLRASDTGGLSLEFEQ